MFPCRIFSCKGDRKDWRHKNPPFSSRLNMISAVLIFILQFGERTKGYIELWKSTLLVMATTSEVEYGEIYHLCCSGCPSSLFSYTDWHTLQWSIVNFLLFVDNMCCWSNKMPWHISSQIKSFVFNFTYHNYYLANYRYTGLITDIPVFNTTFIDGWKVNSSISTKSQYSCKLIYNNTSLFYCLRTQ